MEENEKIGFSSLLDGLHRMYEDGRYTDVTVIVQDREFHCHKVVLSAVSGYFDCMFSSGMKECQEGNVTIQNLKSRTFEDILAYVYKGCDCVTSGNCEDLLQASSMLQMNDLQDMCEQFVLKQVSPENCCGIWHLAKVENCQKLMEVSKNFVLENFDDICLSEDFMRLEKDDLLSIISDDSLRVASEETVCRAALRWVRGDTAQRRCALPDIFSCFRLPLASVDFVLDELDPDPLSVSDPVCVKIVKDAIKFHALPARRQCLKGLNLDCRKHSPQEQLLVVIGRRTTKLGATVTEVLGYSIAERKWFSLPSMPFDIGDDFSVVSYGNDIFVSGGQAKPQVLLLFSAKLAKWKILNNMTYGRYRHAIAAVGESIYVLGGYDFGTIKSVEEYDIGVDRWQQIGNLKFAADGASAAVLGKNIYVFGGWMGFGENTAAVQCFDTASSTCVQVCNMASPTRNARAISNGAQIYVVSPTGCVDVFDGEETVKRLMVIKDFQRQNFGIYKTEAALYIFGGEIAHYIDDFEINTCSSVIVKVDGDQLEGQHLPASLPVPLEVLGCCRTVIKKKYPLLDYLKNIEELDL